MIPAIDALYLAAARPRSDGEPGPVGVSVLIASRDPDVIAWCGPRVARRLYPGSRFGGVLHHEPCDPPYELTNRGEWSEVIIEEV